jgi:hypothetical protein
LNWRDKMSSMGLDLTQDYVEASQPEWIRNGVGITRYTVDFEQLEDELPLDLRPEGMLAKDIKIDPHHAYANVTCEHPLKTTVTRVLISMELLANIRHMAVWDRSMEMRDIERRAINVAKAQHQINQDRYEFDSVSQNTVKVFLGYVLHHMQKKSDLDFILAPQGTHITSVTVIERTRFLYQKLGQLKRMLTLLASLLPTHTSAARFLQVLASIGAAYAYHMLTQTTQGPWSKVYLNELRQHLLVLTKHFLKSSASLLLTGSPRT